MWMLLIVDVMFGVSPLLLASVKSRGCFGEAIRRIIYFNINDLADTSDKFGLSRIDLPEN